MSRQTQSSLSRKDSHEVLLKFRTRRQSLIVQRRVGHAHGVFKHLAVTEEADLCFHSGMLLRARTRGAFGNKLCEGTVSYTHLTLPTICSV